MRRNLDKDPVISLNGIGKTYRGQEVLSDLSLTLYSAEIAVLLGKNGSGKSTLLRIASGLLSPTMGKVETINPGAIGFISHKLLLYSDLTVEENLNFFAGLASAPAAANQAIDYWGLSPHRQKPAGDLSKGLQFRLSAARAFLNSPMILLLDEPTAALDDESLEILFAAIKRQTALGGTALIATHDISRTLGAADRALVIDSGKIAFDTGPALDGLEKAKAAAVELYRTKNR